jgi:CheY-like chemotaxis protein
MATTWKNPVKVATTQDLGSPPSIPGDGKIDSVALAAGNRVLVKDQDDRSENGIYEVQLGHSHPRTARGGNHFLELTKHEPIRILIVDSDPHIGRALIRLLQPADGIEVIATAPDAGTALELAVRLRPTVALVDVGSAQMDGMEIIRNLGQKAPATRVVVLSVYATFRNPALASGACQFQLKDCSRDELAAAIRLAARGQCPANGEG